MIAALTDDGGRVTIPGFYDDILPMSEAEQNQLSLLPFDEKQFFASVGVDGAVGESGFTTLERRCTRPTLDINGMTSGYQGEGSKTIIPSWASVKLTCRLVPEQDPAKIGDSLAEMLEEICPAGIKIPQIMGAIYDHRFLGLTENAKRAYGRATKEITPEACTDCGTCEEKCTQRLKIRSELKQAVDTFAA